jgi:hypothetical protein
VYELYVILFCFIFWEISIVFLTMAVWIFILTNDVQGSPFLHTLARNCYLYLFAASHLTGANWYLLMPLIWFSLIISDVIPIHELRISFH